MWDKVFKNGPSKICGRQPLKYLKWYGLLEADHTPSNFLKAVSTNFTWFIPEYLVQYSVWRLFCELWTTPCSEGGFKRECCNFGNPYLTLFNPTGKYMLKVNKKSLILVCRLSSKLTLKTSEHYYWLHDVNFILYRELWALVV